MRKRICVSLMTMTLFVSLATVAPAYAKSVDGMRAHIPFDFYVGDRLVAAGEHAIKSMSVDESALRIGNGRQSVTILTNSARERSGGGGCPRLVFRKYGDQYFLAVVWAADNTGRTLSESKRERQLRRETAAARNGATEMEIVAIDAR